MPLYDYKCEVCGEEFEDFRHIEDREKVTHCGVKAKLLISKANNDWFRPHWNEHISEDGPVYVESKRHYKELCKKHGVYSMALG